ncbi:hypothetical protein R1flu_009732 [Riccia fluitans]|uniref:Uncharacterized protein n=1 Tax=Riccia fluitans TaxID=41844 RepID=A0ABD1Z356_9MARC
MILWVIALQTESCIEDVFGGEEQKCNERACKVSGGESNRQNLEDSALRMKFILRSCRLGNMENGYLGREISCSADEIGQLPR